MMSQILGNLSNMGELDAILGSWIWPGPALDAVGIWGMNQYMRISLSLYVYIYLPPPSPPEHSPLQVNCMLTKCQLACPKHHFTPIVCY